MVALPADHIMAMPTSIVGSIGVLMQLFTIDGTLGMIGVKSETLKGGDFKDAGSPFRPMRAEDRAYLQRMVDDYHVRFRAHVEKHRTLTGDAAARATVFDGRVFTGDQALAIGLIDSVGTLEDAIDKARELGGDPRARAVMYIRPYGYTGSIYAHQPPPPAQMQSPAMRFELPEAIAPLAPGFYYLWRP
jgi:protease-4